MHFSCLLYHSCNGSPRCLNVSLMVLLLYYTLLPKSQPAPGISAQTHINCDADREDMAPGRGPSSHHVHFCKTETNVINIHGENRLKCIQQTPRHSHLLFSSFNFWYCSAVKFSKCKFFCLCFFNQVPGTPQLRPNSVEKT